MEFGSLPQQNNMSVNSFPYSPTQQNHPHLTKNNRLYHQLLQNNYLNDHIYHPSTTSAPATIKFTSPSPSNYPMPTAQRLQKNDSPVKLLKYSNPYTSFDGSKNSLQVTQSFPSNYSIQQIQNESYSTINLYNLSRNNIEPDFSLSSNNITAKLIHDTSGMQQQNQSTNLGMILQGQHQRQEPTFHDISVLEMEEKMKKYHSEHYSYQSSRDNPNIEDEPQSPLPRMLANKYMRDQLSRKFSAQSPVEDNGNFRPVLNEIHVVPYKINEQVQPYAFSVPVEGQREGSTTQKKSKAASIHLQNSKLSQLDQESPHKHVQTSNRHQHQQQTLLPNVAYYSAQNIPSLSAQQISAQHIYYPSAQQILLPNTNYNNVPTPQHIPLHSDAHDHKIIRLAPKSEPKTHHLSNQKTTRSNSIGCKNKPLAAVKNQYREQIEQERIQESKVTRICKQDGQVKMQEAETMPQQCSIIMESAEVNVCCGMTRQEEDKPTINRINFMERREKGAPFGEAPQTQEPVLGNFKRIGGCKINTMKMIKNFNEVREVENQKKGFKLVGFNSSFPKRNED